MARFAIVTRPGGSKSLQCLSGVVVSAVFMAMIGILSWPAGEALSASPVNEVPRVSFSYSYSYLPAHTTLEWMGRDADGFIDHFEYSVDGQDWIATVDTSEAFVFSAPEPDPLHTDRYIGTHEIRLRAMDNEGAYSNVVTETFTAWNEAPITTILKPDISAHILALGSSVRIAWDGVDPDGPPEHPRPAGYYYKLLRLDTLSPPVPILRVGDPIILFQKGGEWTYHGPDSLEVVLPLGVPGQYVFGVYAVDDSGAVERDLWFGDNVFKFQTGATFGFPTLILVGTGLGTWSCVGVDSIDIVASTQKSLRFTAACSGEAQGEACSDMRWGLDLADPAQPAGWSEWLPAGDLPLLTFFDPALHRLFVQVRDSYDAVTTGILRIQVMEFPFDREVLWVDDCRDATYPNDTQHDAFWASLFRDSGRFGGDWTTSAQVFRYETFGPNDTGTYMPTPPTLNELGRYRLVIWETNGSGYNGHSGLIASATASRDLETYLAAGGTLWVGGVLTVPPLLPSPTPTGPADFTYPKDVANQPNSFAYRFMKLASAQIMNAKGTIPNSNLVGALVFPGKPATYPAMQQDANKVSPFKASVSHCDAVFGPIFAQDAGLVGVIDSLYAYEAKVTTSTYQNRLVALRWHDPSPAPVHGRVQWFGFPLYCMKQAQAQETFNRSIDWFREGGAIPVTLAYFTADRQDDRVVLTWAVAEASDHAGFHVYREDSVGAREQLTEQLLTGRDAYTFTDPNPPSRTVDYWLAEHGRAGDVTWFGPVRVEEAMPVPSLVLRAPLPNPFADGTRISYSLPAASRVRLGVFDILGRRVIELVDELRPSGTHTAIWSGSGEDGRKVAAGFYLVRLQAGDEIRVRKVVLIR